MSKSSFRGAASDQVRLNKWSQVETLNQQSDSIRDACVIHSVWIFG